MSGEFTSSAVTSVLPTTSSKSSSQHPGMTSTVIDDEFWPTFLRLSDETLKGLTLGNDETAVAPDAGTSTTTTEERRMIEGLRKMAVVALRMDGVEYAFRRAWGAHTLIHAPSEVASVCAGWSNTSNINAAATMVSDTTSSETPSFTWKHRLACLALLDVCCSQLGDQTRAKSPYFPVLVNDVLHCLHQFQERQGSAALMPPSPPPPTAAEAATTTDEQGMIRSIIQDPLEQACLLDFIEMLLPDMMDERQSQIMQQACQSLDIDGVEGVVIVDIVRTVMEETVQKWTNLYQQSQYVSPLVFFTPEQHTSIAATKSTTEIQNLLQRANENSSNSEIAGVSYSTTNPTVPWTTSKLHPVDLLHKPFPSLETPFARPLPPPLLPLYGYHEDDEPLTEQEAIEVLEYLHAELIWLTPANLRLMLVPDDEDADRDVRQVLEMLQKQAFVKPLAPNEQRLVLEMLHSSDRGTVQRLLQESGLTPLNLPRLVDHNPMVAHECLLRILDPMESDHSDDEKNEYLSSLVSMDMSLHTMEVVNRLATSHTNATSSTKPPLLHPEYIQLFIGSCIASCENIPDRHAQNRLVRLVCVFIQSLLRHGIVQMEDIYFEVQAFCVEFARIREAAALFKSLKSSAL